VNRLLTTLNFAKGLERMVAQADIQITVGRLLVFCALAGLLAALAAYTIFSSPAVVATLALLATLLPILHVAYVRRRRLAKFLEHLPDALELMSRSLAVGHAFSESLHQVSVEMPEPVATEFRVTFEEQKLGLSLKLALENLSERIPLLDLRLCVTAILIQRETGGNLAEILEKVSLTIRERFRIMEDFKTMTTSARGSAWILCALPFLIVFILTAMNPGYMSVLLHDQRGHYVLAAAALLQVLGIISIRSILRIRI
jgi:tight adherence protein B